MSENDTSENDESGDPSSAAKKPNVDGSTAADQVAADDPKKVEKLAGTEREKDPEE